MTDVWAEFVQARLAEWEAAATAATDGPWTVQINGRGTAKQEWVVVGHTGSMATIMGDVGVGWMAGLPHDGEHIALHDPVSALRQVAFMRSTVAAFRATAEVQAEGDDTRWRAGEVFTLRNVVEEMAAIWDQHPDYPGREAAAPATQG